MEQKQPIVILIFRWIVGLIFLISAIDKAFDVADFSHVVRYNIPVLPSHPAWSTGFATGICVWEAMLGTLLVAGYALLRTAAVTFITLLAFSGILIRMLVDPFAPKCHCAAWLEIAQNMTDDARFGLIRNALLFIMLAVVLAWAFRARTCLTNQEV